LDSEDKAAKRFSLDRIVSSEFGIALVTTNLTKYKSKAPPVSRLSKLVVEGGALQIGGALDSEDKAAKKIFARSDRF